MTQKRKIGFIRNTLTEEDSANKNMCIVSVLAILADIREGQNIKLLLSSAPCSIERKENRELQAAANKVNDRYHLEEPQIQVSVQRLVIQNIFIGDVFETAKPVRPPFWKRF